MFVSCFSYFNVAIPFKYMMYSANVPFNIFSSAVVLFSFFIALCF